MTPRLVVVVALATLVACDSGEDSPSTPDKAKAEAKDDKNASGDAKADAKAKGDDAAKATPSKSDRLDPCSVVTIEQVREAVGIGADVEITAAADKFMKTVCDYQWPKNDGAGFNKLAVSVPRREPADEAAAVAAFKRAIDGYDKAMTVTSKGADGTETKTPPQSTAIDGVGDEARWYPGSLQLTLRKGTAIRHITIWNLSGRDPVKALAVAKKLAAAI